uniref:cytochrome b n=1 Tax=Caulophacus iocasicus TaxID=3031190 RepID=UPI0023F1F83A|nr:cytochrome b [Caulophacus iocasicus]WDY83518.1 cytochrome b [Caulophacus iocasicus]
MAYNNTWTPKRKKHFILNFLSKILTDLPLPTNINYYWNFGSLLRFCLIIQILTGILLAMHYCPEIIHSFNRIAHIERNISSGFILRNLHTNRASIFFLCVYLHIGRNIYHNTWNNKITWLIGITIYLTMIITAFVGYVLPWGQMSFWAATVITNLFSAIPYIGNDVILWIWGRFRVSNSTLNRFYRLHYLFPFILTGLIFIHIIALHTENHSNPTGNQREIDQLPFHHYLTTKDLQTTIIIRTIIFFIITHIPYTLRDPENFIKANPLITPTHIQPEWYFLFAYSILRSIPNKLGGILTLIRRIAILYFIIILKQKNIKTRNHRPNLKLTTWLLRITFLLLTWIGRMPAEEPFTNLRLIITTWYFTTFLTLIPLHRNKEKTMLYKNYTT